MIDIDCRDRVSESVTFLVDGKHFVSSSVDGKIRRWRAEDGKEVGIPMEVGNAVLDITASRDGKWIVSGTIGDGVTVWNAESHEKVPVKFKTDPGLVFAIDVSPDGAKIASGSGDSTACVWSFSTGERLLGPLKHDNVVVGVKFSPDGRLLATATEDHCNAIRIYDSQTGCLLFDFPITVSDAASNHSFAWAGDSKQLFALSRVGNVYCFDASDGTTLSHWPIHSRYPPVSIALASDGTFIAVAADTSVSFWDSVTHERIGSVIERTAPVVSMSISTNYDIVISTGSTISVVGLCDVLPFKYLDVMVRDGETLPVSVEMADVKETIKLPGAEDKGSIAPIAALTRLC
ncbi:WD40 repeat-like protein [Imleria badia]|nr:WD40 repeat-like protein [Imleria badia]